MQQKAATCSVRRAWRLVGRNDLETDPQRSALMGRVRQRKTAAELAVARALRELGVAYRLNVRSLPGSPDFANKRRRWAIFVHGCFWHQHRGCVRATVPKRNRLFWLAKFEANRRRDAHAVRKLRSMSYQVVIVWECQAAHDMGMPARLEQLRTRLDPTPC